MNGRAPLRRIVVVGSGLTAFCAATSFARALPAAVTLVALPADPASLADRLPALDWRSLDLLAGFGLTEPMLVAAGAATHRVGSHLAWGGRSFTIGEGEDLPMLAGAALLQLSLAHGDGTLDSLVPGAALANAERFVHPGDDPGSPASHFGYTLRLDPERALPLFARAAQAARVRWIEAGALAIDRDGPDIARLTVDGVAVEADLFVDASGAGARLAGPAARWVDWRATVPADRLRLANRPAAPSPLDRYELQGDGWTARWPLAARTLAGFAYAAAVTGDGRARRLFPGGGETIALHPRRQVSPFAGNVLALGDAAAMVGPLGWLGLPLALAQLRLAIELMPARGDGPELAQEYNRRATLAADHVHAYAAAFYTAGPPRRGAFWHGRSSSPPPPDLAATLVQFGRRGTLPPEEEATMSRAAWQQALIGLGVRPERRDPLALSVPHATAAATLAGWRAAVAALPGQVPPYPAYLAAMARRASAA